MSEAVDLLEPTLLGSAGRAQRGEAEPAPRRTGATSQVAERPVVERVANRLEWRIRCNDALDRERCLTVVVDNGQVLVVGPPGEAAVLSPGQLGQFRTALLEAAERAER